jgi:diguanylate cyclase (GGDEF)-like protein
MSGQISSRSLRNLVCIAIAIAGAAVFATGLTIWGLRADAVADTERDTGNLATIFAEQTNQSVKALDGALVDIKERLAAIHKTSPEKYSEAIRSEEVFHLLADAASRLPQADVIAVLSADGRVVNHSQDRPGQNIDVSDREFFAVQRAADSGMYVSVPVVSRMSLERTLFLSRRIESPQGEFLGMVQIGVRISYFQHIYGSISSLSDQSFLFLRSDGTVLARFPDQKDRAGEKMPSQSAWYGAVARGGGFYRSPGYFDGDARFVAVRNVADYPLVVDVAASESASLALWRRRATMIAIGTILTLVCVALLLRTLVVQFYTLVASQASLAERETKLSEKSGELERANQTVDAALNNMSQGLSMVDTEGRVVICNERYMRMYEIPPGIVGPGVRLADVLAYRKRHGNFEGDPEGFAAALRVRMADGERVHTRSQLADGRLIAVVNEPMAGGGWVATHDDITERQRSQERIARMARHDALTDLANRLLFRERMDEAFDRYENTGRGYTIFIFDLDLFKAVNDSLGHPVGDALLKAVAQRLQEVTRETDTVGRLGGDEFAILQHAEGQQRERAVALAQRLLQVVGAPYEIDGHRVVIGISIGIAMAPHDGLDSAHLLKNADLALYRAKADGRNTHRFFEQEMDEDLRVRHTLEIDLHNAIAKNEFEAYYQPMVDLDTGDTCAVEALIRWHHPAHGMISPDRFIPVAEERGMIAAIGRWMLRQACGDAATWPPHIRVAVNLSPVQFRNSELLEIVSTALADSGLAPERLELEITESVLLQKNARDLSILHQIKALGVSVALDDFGTGYSSLSYLRLFPFDKIKIDKSFVREMSSRADCAAIVCAITNLGRELNMVTTAEGVETQEQLELVRAAGCKLAQGFLFSRPCPASELTFATGQTVALLQSAAG